MSRRCVLVLALALLACDDERPPLPDAGLELQLTLADDFRADLVTGLTLVGDAAPGGPATDFHAGPPLTLATEPVTITALGSNVDYDRDTEYVLRVGASPFAGGTFSMPLRGTGAAPFALAVELLGERGVLASEVVNELADGHALRFAPFVSGTIPVTFACRAETTCRSAENRPPVLAALAGGLVEIAIGKTLRLTLDAYDPDGDPLAFAADLGALAGLADAPVFDAAARTLTWTPAVLHGPTELRFSVSDGRGGVATQPLLLRAAIGNSTPVWQPRTPRLATTGRLTAIPLRVADPDGDPVTVTVNTSGLPPGNGAAWDAASGELRWTTGPRDARAEPYPIVLLARDGRGGAATLHLEVEVASPSRPPELVVPQRVYVQPGTALRLPVLVTDPGVTLSLDKSGLPANADAVLEGATLSWTPADADVRYDPYRAQIVADDGRRRSTAGLELIVGRDPPSPLFTVAPATVTEGETLELPIAVPPGATLALDPNNYAARNGATLEGSTFRWTPAPGLARSAPYGVAFEAANGAAVTKLVARVAVDPARPGRPPAKLDVAMSPKVVVAGEPFRPRLEVWAEDAQGRLADFAPDVTIALGANPGGATLAGTLTAPAPRGVALFGDLTLDVPGRGYTIVARALRLAEATSLPFDVVAGPAARLDLEAPERAVAGTPRALVVRAFDRLGNVATGYAGTLTFACSDPRALLPEPAEVSARDLGVRVFEIAFAAAGRQTVQVLDAENGALVASVEVEVAPGPAAALELVGLPVEGVSGEPLAAAVSARDAFGNPTPDYAGVVQVTANDPDALVPPELVFGAGDEGRRSFAGLTLRRAGATEVRVTDRSDATLGGAAVVTVRPGAPAALRLGGIPGIIGAGTSSRLTVAAVDAAGNVAPSYRGTIAFASTDPKAGLPLSYTFTAADAGAHTFSNGVTLRTAGPQRVSASGGITGTTGEITVLPAATASLKVDAPAQVRAGDALELTVSAQDAYGNLAMSYAGTVALSSDDPRASLPPFVSIPSGAGAVPVAARLASAGTRLVKANDVFRPTLQGRSGAIAVRPGDAVRLGFASQPTTASARAVLAPPFVVRVHDAYDNPLPDATPAVSVSLAVRPPPGDGELTGTLLVTAAGGVAELADLAIDRPGVGYRLRASSGGLAAAESAELTITALPALARVCPPLVREGAELALRGTDFDPVAPENNRVDFAGLAGTVLAATRQKLVVRAPVGLAAVGTIRVTVGADSSGELPFTRGPESVLAADAGLAVAGSGLAADGRTLAFLAAPDGGAATAYLRDFGAGTTSAAQPGAESLALSADGRFLRFATGSDLYLRDLVTGAVEAVSLGAPLDPSGAISADDRFVFFASAGALHVRDRRLGLTSRLPLEGEAFSASLDGRAIAFASAGDVYVYDRDLERLERATVGAAASEPRLSGDGRVLAFYSASSALGANPSGRVQLWAHDRETGTTRAASLDPATGLAGASGGPPFGAPALSADGRLLAFSSWDASGEAPDVLVYDGARAAVSWVLRGLRPSLSLDGQYVAFEDSEALFRAPLPADDCPPPAIGMMEPLLVRAGSVVGLHGFGFDPTPAGNEVRFGERAAVVLAADAHHLQVVAPAGVVAGEVTVTVAGQTSRGVAYRVGSLLLAGGARPRASADGRVVAFAASDGVFVARVRGSGIERVSEDGRDPSISADGRFVALATIAPRVVVRDRVSGGVVAALDGAAPSLSADGSRVAYVAALAPRVYVRDLVLGETTDVTDCGAGCAPDGPSFDPAVGQRARHVAFASDATNLAPGDGNGVRDVFLRDTCFGATSCTPATVRVSVSGGGAEADGPSMHPAVSYDGCRVAFASDATNLVPGDTNGARDVFVRDVCAGSTMRVSDGESDYPSLSADGRFVAFVSAAGGVHVHDTCAGAPGGCVPSTRLVAEGVSASLSPEGSYVALSGSDGSVSVAPR